jgi:hypothetical protein
VHHFETWENFRPGRVALAAARQTLPTDSHRRTCASSSRSTPRIRIRWWARNVSRTKRRSVVERARVEVADFDAYE